MLAFGQLQSWSVLCLPSWTGSGDRNLSTVGITKFKKDKLNNLCKYRSYRALLPLLVGLPSTGTLANYGYGVLMPVRERHYHWRNFMHKHKWGITGEAITLQIGEDKLGGLFKPFILGGVFWLCGVFFAARLLPLELGLSTSLSRVSPTVQEKTNFAFSIAPNQPHKKWYKKSGSQTGLGFVIKNFKKWGNTVSLEERNLLLLLRWLIIAYQCKILSVKTVSSYIPQSRILQRCHTTKWKKKWFIKTTMEKRNASKMKKKKNSKMFGRGEWKMVHELGS